MTDMNDPWARIFSITTGFMASEVLKAVVEAGIADRIGDEPRSARELASEAGVHAPTLNRMLRCLTAHGVFERKGDGVYAHNAASMHLREDSEHSAAAIVRMITAESRDAWREAQHTLKTGKPCFENAFGSPIFDYLDDHPQSARIFHAAMRTNPQILHVLVDSLPLSSSDEVTDVGGGNGHLLSAIIRRHPGISTVLLDRQEGIAAAKSEQGGPLPGCKLVVGDFFSEVPDGADAYILQKIIHDWDDDASVSILCNIAAAMKPESRLYIIDMILDPDDSIGTRSDLYMLVVCGGAERTIEESDALYAKAGLKRTKVIETNAPWKVIEAKLAN